MKKIISLGITLSIVLGSVAFAEQTYSDFNIDDVSAIKIYNIMSGYDDGTFKPGNTITRAEFTKAAVMAYEAGYSSELELGNTSFSDVDVSHWYYDYISKAVNIGIISGYDDGTFRPEEMVTYEQAAVIIFSTLGYKPVADMYGGYPYAYMALSYKNKLFFKDPTAKHMEFSIEMDEQKAKEYITRSDAAYLLDYMFYIPICEVSNFIDDEYGKIPIYSIGGNDEIKKTLWSMRNVTLLPN